MLKLARRDRECSELLIDEYEISSVEDVHNNGYHDGCMIVMKNGTKYHVYSSADKISKIYQKIIKI